MAEAKGVCKALSILCRIAALGLSVTAIVVMSTASQLVLVDGSPESSSYSISYSHYKALRYFVPASAIAAVFSAAALYVFAVHADATVGSLPLVPFLDAATQGLLFSAAGAALTARDVLQGSVCDAAGAFCGRVTVAAAVCAVAAVCAAVAALARDAGHGSSEGRCCDDW